MIVLDEAAWAKLDPKPNMDTCNTMFYGSDSPLKIVGQFTTRIWHRGRSLLAAFIVVKGRAECLLSFKSAKDLNLI